MSKSKPRLTMTITPRRLLTEDESRNIKAVIASLGLTQRQFAEANGVSYQRLAKMLQLTESVGPKYARLFNQSLRALHRRLDRIAA